MNTSGIKVILWVCQVADRHGLLHVWLCNLDGSNRWCHVHPDCSPRQFQIFGIRYSFQIKTPDKKDQFLTVVFFGSSYAQAIRLAGCNGLLGLWGQHHSTLAIVFLVAPMRDLTYKCLYWTGMYAINIDRYIYIYICKINILVWIYIYIHIHVI